jgi:hypothetical protein
MSGMKSPVVPRVVGLTGAVFGAGTQAALWVVAPHLAVAVAILESSMAIAVILTALYAPEKYSTRAFRLLPWTTRQTANR